MNKEELVLNAGRFLFGIILWVVAVLNLFYEANRASISFLLFFGGVSAIMWAIKK